MEVHCQAVSTHCRWKFIVKLCPHIVDGSSLSSCVNTLSMDVHCQAVSTHCRWKFIVKLCPHIVDGSSLSSCVHTLSMDVHCQAVSTHCRWKFIVKLCPHIVDGSSLSSCVHTLSMDEVNLCCQGSVDGFSRHRSSPIDVRQLFVDFIIVITRRSSDKQKGVGPIPVKV
ncbi:hypothetical protein M8J77_006366 [Diaphorina citri]|nr:hypothetical protein M8J77_006366 [Diaphorina citri]